MIFNYDKGVSFHLALPGVDEDDPSDFLTGESPADAAYYKDGAGAWTSLAISDTFAEIGSTGIYEITLSNAEANHDMICIKMTSANIADSFVIGKAKTTVDVGKISGDSVAADNCESYFDGTGYSHSNNKHTLIDVTETQIDDIETQTDKMNFTGDDIKATVTLSAADANMLADHMIRRTAVNARASADGDTINFRSLLGVMSKLTNRVKAEAALLTIFEEDDITEFKQQVLTRDVNANPIIEMDTS